MPEYLSPGVYIEEVDAGPRPIAGVSTSTAGMVGVTVRGPVTGKPQLVTNFLEFQRTFGGFLPEPSPALAATWERNAADGGRWWTFALSVKGFFDNGGRRLYVKRVVSGGARPATGDLGRGLVSEVTRDAAAGSRSIEIRHMLGFAGNGQAIAICRGDNGNEIAGTTVVSYSAVGPRIELADPLPQEVRVARGDFVRVGPPATPGNGRSVTFTAASPGTWGQHLRVRVRPMAAAVLPLLPDSGEGRIFVTRLASPADADSPTVTVAPVAGLDPGELGDDVWVRIGRQRYKVTVRRPEENGPVELAFEPDTTHPQWPAGFPVQRVRRATSTERQTLRVANASRLYRDAVVQIDDGRSIVARTVASVTGDKVALNEDLPQSAVLFEDDRLSLVEAEVAVRFTDEAGDTVTETFGNLRLTGDDPAGLIPALNTRSQLVRAAAADGLIQLPRTDRDPILFPTAPNVAWLDLSGGDDGYDSLSVADFVGEDGGSGARTGIAALEDIDEVAICAVPGMWSGTVQAALIAHCEYLKDRFAILDPQNGLSIEGVREFREPYDTSYAALYYPWLVTRHPTAGLDVEVPPSGHIAGIYARVDVERGVHKAPANAIIRGIRVSDGIAQDVTRRHQDLLNPQGINALRFFAGQGHRVWGARTLSSDSAWRYVNVRRLFLFIEESIEEGTQWVVFEPNREPLWALVRQTVENFLGTVWRSGALAGTTPDEAFFVACDRTTMTEDDLQNGRLVCVVGVAPVHPAEFVIFRIQQKTRETQLA
jgi:uncharacterized protein